MDDRKCPNCGRVYEAGDWQEANCPFCDVQLETVKGNVNILSDTISQNVAWPEGQPRAKVFVATGYLEAQLVKAQLEAEGVPVFLSGNSMGSIYGLTIGPMSEVQVFVPQNHQQEAIRILKNG